MKEKLVLLVKKYKTFLLYVLFGIPPTIVSFGGYYLWMDVFGLSAAISNWIAWVMGLVISFFIYRRFVFHSENRTILAIWKEFVKYTGMRITSGLMETGFVWLFVDFLHWERTIFKILASLMAALLNFFVSKLFVFRARE